MCLTTCADLTTAVVEALMRRLRLAYGRGVAPTPRRQRYCAIVLAAVIGGTGKPGRYGL